jgi:hypothetical protein
MATAKAAAASKKALQQKLFNDVTINIPEKTVIIQQKIFSINTIYRIIAIYEAESNDLLIEGEEFIDITNNFRERLFVIIDTDKEIVDLCKLIRAIYHSVENMIQKLDHLGNTQVNY